MMQEGGKAAVVGAGRQQWWVQEGRLLVSDTVLHNFPSPDLTQQKSLRSGFGGLT